MDKDNFFGLLYESPSYSTEVRQIIEQHIQDADNYNEALNNLKRLASADQDVCKELRFHVHPVHIDSMLTTMTRGTARELRFLLLKEGLELAHHDDVWKAWKMRRWSDLFIAVITKSVIVMRDLTVVYKMLQMQDQVKATVSARIYYFFLGLTHFYVNENTRKEQIGQLHKIVRNEAK